MKNKQKKGRRKNLKGKLKIVPMKGENFEKLKKGKLIKISWQWNSVVGSSVGDSDFNFFSKEKEEKKILEKFQF